MSAIKEQVKLIYSDCTGDENKNKVWIGILYDNNDVETQWGRIGNTLQSKRFNSVGRHYLQKKKDEKLKKGYTELHVVETVANSTKTIANSSLNVVAKRDIIVSSPELTKLIDRLVKSNIHTIVSSTTLSYNDTTGLFSTPLGVVTQHAIDEARDILAEIKLNYNNEVQLRKLTSTYLRFIPHAVGMKLNPYKIFPDGDEAIQKELNIIDSLQASYDASQTPVVKPDAKPESSDAVFKVNLDSVAIGSPEYKMCMEFFAKTNKPQHGYQNLRVGAAYKVDINHMSSNFDSGKVGKHTQVWHGSSEANLLSILKHGLKTSPPSTAYIAGKMFGNGIYGSETASKSLGYTMGRWGGSTSSSGWLFICDFAMGNPYYPTHTIQRIPAGYHSCWALPGKCGLANDELIVYQDQQVNIKYLLEIVR
jgi:poly [ADP-ribose] polymerase